jgi:hypothetical protein
MEGDGGKRDGDGDKEGKGEGGKRDGNDNEEGKGEGGKRDGNGDKGGGQQKGNHKQQQRGGWQPMAMPQKMATVVRPCQGRRQQRQWQRWGRMTKAAAYFCMVWW